LEQDINPTKVAALSPIFVGHGVFWSGQTKLSRLVVDGQKLGQVGSRLLSITERTLNHQLTGLKKSVRLKLPYLHRRVGHVVFWSAKTKLSCLVVNG
jgi:hypothetical protein